MRERRGNRDSLRTMKRIWRSAGPAFAFGALLAAGAVWAAPPETFGIAGPAEYKTLKPVRPTPAERLGIDLGTVPAVRLPAVDREALLREDAAASWTAR